MALILTFLGKGGTGRTTLAIAAAKQLATQGKRVLLAHQGNNPAFQVLVGATVGSEPGELAPNLQAVHLHTPFLLEKGWEEVKKLEAEYLRTPFFKEIYGQELAVLPGLDAALAMNELRLYDASSKYDVLIYDGGSDSETLRMFGVVEIISWYLRRFRQVLDGSDIIKALSPFAGPISSAILNVEWSPDSWMKNNKIADAIEEGKAALADPNRIAAYLVTTEAQEAIETIRYRWGCAQQVGLTVAGVLLNQVSQSSAAIDEAFAPLDVQAIPTRADDNWQPLMSAMPDFTKPCTAPRPIAIDLTSRQVRLFLPGFDKKQVKLIQSGPEVTIEAGDQRRNIFLPPELRGKPVTGAKFQDRYLTISF
jgi:anion-transporting  ArsA/GET3 family ATPase